MSHKRRDKAASTQISFKLQKINIFSLFLFVNSKKNILEQTKEKVYKIRKALPYYH